MASKIVFLHGQPSRIGHFVRIGSSGHRQLETLVGAGRMPAESLVVEAGSFGRQTELISSLKEAGRELILDTNVAELSSVGKFEGHVRAAPWADPDGVLTADHFARGPNYDIAGQIARFAVRHGFDAVHAPTHFLSGSTSSWLPIDRNACVALRRALDVEGGRNISIDYPLMTTFTALRDPIQRRAFMAALKDLPFGNLWLRVSGFGADATGMGVRRYIAAASDLLRLGKPIVADGIGGLAALAIVAFGGAGGFAHGVAEKERFDATSWDKPPTGGGGGSEKRILIPGLDRQLTLSQMETLMGARSGRRLCSCSDRRCCPHGWDDTRKDPKGHYLYQRSKQVRALSAIPDAHRIQHFLGQDLADAARIARTVARIRVGDASLHEALERSSVRLERMTAVLSELQKTIGDAPRSAAPVGRFTSTGTIASGRRG
jgi:hypothetical protein